MPPSTLFYTTDKKLKCGLTARGSKIALLLRRTRQAVMNRRLLLGIPYSGAKFKRFTDQENRIIGAKPDREIALIRRRSVDSIKQQRQKLDRPSICHHEKLTVDRLDKALPMPNAKQAEGSVSLALILEDLAGWKHPPRGRIRVLRLKAYRCY